MVGFRTKTPFSTGKWLRASFYTGSTTVDQVEALVAFMRAFAATWQRDHQGKSAAAQAERAEAAAGAAPMPSHARVAPLPLRPLRPVADHAISRPPFGAHNLPTPKAGGLAKVRGSSIKSSMSLDSGLPSRPAVALA